jgi:hypothetical protein
LLVEEAWVAIANITKRMGITMPDILEIDSSSIATKFQTVQLKSCTLLLDGNDLFAATSQLSTDWYASLPIIAQVGFGISPIILTILVILFHLSFPKDNFCSNLEPYP